MIRLTTLTLYLTLCLQTVTTFAMIPNWQETKLTEGWRIKSIPPEPSLSEDRLANAISKDSPGWLATATMPAMVHDILQQHELIEAPWRPGAAEACQWVAEKDWLYACTFTASSPKAPAILHFYGLDTLVDVYLNGQRLGSHANMYWPLHVDVTGKLQAQNNLVLHFHTVFEDENGKKKPLRQRNGQPVRRPGQNYGSYLGPRPLFSRVGVYDRITLEVFHGTRLAKVAANATVDKSLRQGTVTVDLAGESQLSAVAFIARLLEADGTVAAQANSSTKVQAGTFRKQIQLSLEKPKLWWPRGYGDQPLYQLEVQLLADGLPHQTLSRTLGFRRVTQIQPLHFVVNNVPVRLWGGDWVTPRWESAVWDRSRVTQLLDMAEHANFNAFRVWGVVEAPHDHFYQEADARGFMLWQDFTDLPLGGDDQSRSICRTEAALLIKRLKHHPSIFIWCGGNENAMWHHPEFNNELEDRGPWPGLASAQAVAEVCQKLDPGRPYRPTSPYGGDNPNAPESGNTHGYTNMWFVSGYDYLNFASEDTRIAAPPLHSLKRFMAPEDIWPADYSPVFAHGNIHPYPPAWLKYTTGSSWKKTGPVEQFYDATSPAELVYRLGMAESLYYRDTVERQRRGRAATDPLNRRRCGGYLVWKYNDSWPQVYSAKVDYFLEPYHCYYALRRAYQPVMLSFEKGPNITLWAANDTREAVSGTVRLQLFHMERNAVRREVTRDVTLPPGESKVIVNLAEAGMHTFRLEHLLLATLTDASGQLLARTDTRVDMERRLRFPEAKLEVQVQAGELRITTDQYAHAVTLAGDANGDPFGWFFSDNYFNLLPGESKSVRVLGDRTEGTITAKPHHSPHTSTVAWKRETLQP